MNPLDELRSFVLLHARAQRLSDRAVHRVLGRISRDSGAGPGSWVGEWSDAAAAASARGGYAQASALYGIARFPYVDGPARAEAHQRCLQACEMALRRRPEVARRTVRTDEGSFVYYSRAAPGRPLLAVLGGIVSLKEQWAQVLSTGRRLGMAVAVTELPGVGENTLPYTPASWCFLSLLLDDVGDQADTSACYVLGMSFGGHLALQASLHDPRIRGVATVGAPITHFFSRPERWQRLPVLTRRTLAHLTRTTEADLPARLPQWRLDEAALGQLSIPVRYVASSRDEIIPSDEVATLLRYAPHARAIEFDDVHGSPGHVTLTRVWLAMSLRRMRADGLRGRVLDAALRAGAVRPVAATT